jgi:hypothetical protein
MTKRRHKRATRGNTITGPRDLVEFDLADMAKESGQPITKIIADIKAMLAAGLLTGEFHGLTFIGAPSFPEGVTPPT